MAEKRAVMVGDVVRDLEEHEFIVEKIYEDNGYVSLKTIGVGFTVMRRLDELTFVREATDE